MKESNVNKRLINAVFVVCMGGVLFLINRESRPTGVNHQLNEVLNPQRVSNESPQQAGIVVDTVALKLTPVAFKKFRPE